MREVSFSTTISFYFKTTQRYRTVIIKEIARCVVCSRLADTPPSEEVDEFDGS